MKKITVLTVVIWTLLVTSILAKTEKDAFKPSETNLTAKELGIPTRNEFITSNSTEIIIGEVIYKQAKWINSTNDSGIYTFAQIQIETAEKVTHSHNKKIWVVYEGGTVGKVSATVMRNPWGVVDIPENRKIRLYLKKSSLFKGHYYVLKCETLCDDEDTFDLLLGNDDYPMRTYTAKPWMYETLRLRFAWLYNKDREDYSDIPYYVINTSVPAYLEDDEWLNAFHNAFEEWEDESKSDITWDYMGNRTSITDDNGYSEIGWTDLDGGTLATCTWWPSSGVPKDEFDIRINTDYTWVLGVAAGYYDLQSTVTHEVGHAIGLWDLEDTGPSHTMWYQGTLGSISQRSLATGDQLGAQYASPAYTVPTVDITDPIAFETFDQNTDVDIVAEVDDNGATIYGVWYQISSYYDYDYVSIWASMTESNGEYTATWNTDDLDGWYWLLVRARTTDGVYGYDRICVIVEP